MLFFFYTEYICFIGCNVDSKYYDDLHSGATAKEVKKLMEEVDVTESQIANMIQNQKKRHPRDDGGESSSEKKTVPILIVTNRGCYYIIIQFFLIFTSDVYNIRK